jgi:hypothetical protein
VDAITLFQCSTRQNLRPARISLLSLTHERYILLGLRSETPDVFSSPEGPFSLAVCHRGRFSCSRAETKGIMNFVHWHESPRRRRQMQKGIECDDTQVAITVDQ